MPTLGLRHASAEQIAQFAQRLIRTRSLSGEEGALATLLVDEMRRVGLEDVRTDRIGNVIGRIGSGEHPLLMLEGHMDTVGCGDPSAWEYDPFEARIVDGVLHGLGAVDMKGALAAMVYGAAALRNSATRMKGTLYVVGVVQEEPCEGSAVRVLVEEEGIRPDYVIIGEATNLQLSRGQRGRLELRITANGKAAHASAPERGKNAIYEATRILVGIELMLPQMEVDSFLGKASLSVTQIESSSASRNAVPDRCVMHLDRRLTAGETEAKAVAELKNLIARVSADAVVEVTEHHARSYTGYEFRARQYLPCWTLQESHPLVLHCARAIERSLRYRPKVGRWDFSTDGVYTAGVAGIPTVGIGPGEEKYAHTRNEQVKVQHLLDAARVYAQLGADLLTGA